MLAISGEQDYQSLKPSYTSSWSDPELSIGLVYAKKKRTKKRDVYTGRGDDPKKKPFVKIKFKLIQNISGHYVVDESDWFPKINTAGERRELGRVGKPRSFAFWDRRGLSVPLVGGYSAPTSCGAMPSKTLLPNQYYLHFKKGERTIGFEIVSGPDDPLVNEFVENMKGRSGTKIRRAPKDYFEEMSGYQDLVLSECPSESELEILRWGFSSGSGGPKTVNSKLITGQHSHHNSQPKDLSVINFMSYQRHVNGRDLECQIGKRYLVLDKVSKRPSYGQSGMFFVNPPQHRFIEVTNGKIDTDDILSQITIIPDENNESLVEVDDVKIWIREANPK